MAPSTKSEKNGEKKKVKKTHSYSVYIHRVLKIAHPDLTISNKSMNIMNSFVIDALERVAEEAGRLVKKSKKRTMTARDIQAAVKLVFPEQLAKFAVADGTKAMALFENNK